MSSSVQTAESNNMAVTVCERKPTEDGERGLTGALAHIVGHLEGVFTSVTLVGFNDLEHRAGVSAVHFVSLA